MYNGQVITGWQSALSPDKKQTYFYYFSPRYKYAVTGRQYIDGQWYNFDSKGRRV